MPWTCGICGKDIAVTDHRCPYCRHKLWNGFGCRGCGVEDEEDCIPADGRCPRCHDPNLYRRHGTALFTCGECGHKEGVCQWFFVCPRCGATNWTDIASGCLVLPLAGAACLAVGLYVDSARLAGKLLLPVGFCLLVGAGWQTVMGVRSILRHRKAKK